MIALNIVNLRILYSLWHYRDSNILAYGYELCSRESVVSSERLTASLFGKNEVATYIVSILMHSINK